MAELRFSVDDTAALDALREIDRLSGNQPDLIDRVRERFPEPAAMFRIYSRYDGAGRVIVRFGASNELIDFIVESRGRKS